MAQNPGIIELDRSYIPMDPNSFPMSMSKTSGEDAPEARIPVIPYDGYNFMPTQYGYRSYFGVNSILDVDALISRVDELFIVQTDTYENIAVALCEDGIWTKLASVAGAWTNIIPLFVPTAGTHKNWSKCVINNTVLMYRAGEANFWEMNQDNSWVPTAQTPTILNMAAQQGIFKAGGRLAFWDSDDSTAWSNPLDFTDMTPSLETGAGAAKWQYVKGKIVVIRQHGNGFVIYCTRSIVSVKRGPDANQFWLSEEVFEGNGISYLYESVQGQPDTIHYAYTTFGMVKITDGKAEYIIPEVFSYLKEKKDPIFLSLLEGRYLFVQLLNADYVLGTIQFSYEIIPEITISFEGAAYALANPTEDLIKTMVAVNNQQQSYIASVLGFNSNEEATDPSSVPMFEDHLASVFSVAEITAWKDFNASLFGTDQYFAQGAWTANGGITKIDGSGEEYFLPAVNPLLVSAT